MKIGFRNDQPGKGISQQEYRRRGNVGRKIKVQISIIMLLTISWKKILTVYVVVKVVRFF